MLKKIFSDYSDKELTTFRRNNIGFVFQNYNLVPNLTAKENVELSIQISNSDADVMDVLKQCGLTPERIIFQLNFQVENNNVYPLLALLPANQNYY